MSAYTQKFKDPRWQKKRLEILEQYEFTCGSCGQADKTLNVHHLYYERMKDPWEYPQEAYSVLCEKCHLEWHENKLFLDKVIGCHPENISLLIGYAKAVNTMEPFECLGVIECSGFADYYKTNLDVMQYLVSKKKGVPPEIFRQAMDAISALEIAHRKGIKLNEKVTK